MGPKHLGGCTGTICRAGRRRTAPDAVIIKPAAPLSDAAAGGAVGRQSRGTGDRAKKGEPPRPARVYVWRELQRVRETFV